MASWLRASLVVGLVGVAVLGAACGDDDATTTPGGATSSSGDGGASSGTDAKAFVDEDSGPTPDPEGRKPNDPLRVFVTKATFAGDLDGTSGASTKCKEAAEAASIAPKGKWVAWLSTPASDVKKEIVEPAGTLPYQLLDGTPVVAKAADLVSDPGTLLHAIDRSEAKEKVSGHVWTGTQGLGAPAVTACLGWTNGDADHKGGAGDVAGKDLEWTELATPDTCSTKNHLYCFEVP